MSKNITGPKVGEAENIEAENMRQEMTFTIGKLDKTRLRLVQHTAQVLLMQQQMTEKEE